MAATHFSHRRCFFLLCFHFLTVAALEKRFSDFKRCADQECSNLLIRGKATADFSGPDCRFLSFKKSETVFVYYKLSGRRADMWAGSVGSHFGYFPKDLLVVNHIYTHKELEVPTEETDFVCFETGYDQFDNYDIDVLLGSANMMVENADKITATSGHTQKAEATLNESKSLAGEKIQSTSRSDFSDKSETLDGTPDGARASLSQIDVASESLATVAQSEAVIESGVEDLNKQKASEEKALKSGDGNHGTRDDIAVLREPLEKDNLINESFSVSEGMQIPKLKTTLGTTMDVLISDDEITRKVTPYEEEESDQLENHLEEDHDVQNGTPLLSFFEQTPDTTLSAKETESDAGTEDAGTEDAGEDKDSEQKTSEEEVDKNSDQMIETRDSNAVPEEELLDKDNLVTQRVTVYEGRQIPKLKTTLGTTFDAVVTDDINTQKVTPYEEEENDQLESPLQEDLEVPKGTPLLPFFEDTDDTAVTDPTIVDNTKDEDDEKETSEEVDDKNDQKNKNSDSNAVPEVELLDKDHLVTERVSVYEGVQIPKLKTTLGTTFDAVVSDDEITKKVTPYEEEESEQLESPPEEVHEVPKGTPLLPFFEETDDTTVTDPAIVDDKKDDDNEKETSEEVVYRNYRNYQKPKTSDTHVVPEVELTDKDNLVTEKVSVYEGVQIPKLKTTLGTTFDAVVSDDEITQKVTPYEEEESEQLESPPEEAHKVPKGTPLLSFFEERAKALVPDSFIKQNNQHVDEAPTVEDKNMEVSLDEAESLVRREGQKTTEDTDVKVEEDVPSETFQSLAEEKDDIQVVPSESSKLPENREQIVKDPLSVDISETFEFDETDEEVTRQQDSQKAQEALKATDKHSYHNHGTSTSGDSEFQDDSSAKHLDESLETETTEDSTEEDVSKEPPFGIDDASARDSSTGAEHTEDLDKTLEESMSDQDEFRMMETESNQATSVKELNPDVTVEHTEHLDKTSEENTIGQDQLTETESNQEEPVKENLGFKVKGEKLEDNPITTKSEGSDTTQSKPESSVKEMELLEDHIHEKDTKGEEEELLEDENAVSFSESRQLNTDQPSPISPPMISTSESQYRDSVMRLTVLRGHFTDQTMKQLQNLLGLKNLFKVESMFSDLEAELKTVRFSHSGNTQDVENALESILEASEDTILQEIETMLVNQETKQDKDDASHLDEDDILDEFQELAFSLRQKYSTASDSTVLATEKPQNIIQDDDVVVPVEDSVPHALETVSDSHPETEGDERVTQTQVEENPMDIKVDQMTVDEIHRGPDVSVSDDSGQFNRNKDDQPSFSAPDDVQEPETNLENPLDVGPGVEEEHSQFDGSLDSKEPVPDVDEESDFLSTGIAHITSIFTVMKTKLAEWTVVVISLLPEEWKPGETLFGCPWHAVVITALVGVVTFTLFFWRTVLAVKKREYLVDEKKLKEQIQALKDEKKNALTKISDLQKRSEELKNSRKESEQTINCTTKRLQELEAKVVEAEMKNKQMMKEKNTCAKRLEEERVISQKNETKIENLEKSVEKLQSGKKKIQETLAKTTVLLDEAKIREDARNVQHKSLKKDHEALKAENKTLKVSIKTWEDKHKELSEQIKIYQNSQKELEDSVVLKDHNVEVLSELLSDLDACDMQKGGSVLENGEVAPDKKTAVRNRIKQMMDVSRVQTTLAVVEEERDRFMAKLLAAEKTRKALEEQHQELEHAITALKREKSHTENQFNILQQKNEIMVEMYQQKENALQQKLTKEELERRSRESLLSEVGGKALEAEEQVKVLRQRIGEMEDQMKKTEEVYKEQVKEQENKTHSNWVNARNAERALNQEKVEASKLREKLAVLTAQLNDRRAPLFRPNSGQPPGPRQGDSYGPSPVSGGAPSPPVMIEGPRRPPSAPVGRRIDPYGPRPPSDPHGRYPDNKHVPGMDMTGPRSSSPANMDGPGPGSFIASPIRDSSGSMLQGPPPGPHDPLLPPGASRLPPPGPYRLPRPGPYPLPPGMAGPHGPFPPHGPPLPANGHPGMPLPPPTNGHTFLPRPGPGHAFDPRGPPPPHFRPSPPPRFGLMPPQGVRGSVGPRPPIHPDGRFFGQRDQANVPTGGSPHPAQVLADGPQSSARPHDSGQDPSQNQEAVPQNLARPAVVKP